MADPSSPRDTQSRKRVREGGSEKLNYSQRRAVKWKSKMVRAGVARKEQTDAKAKTSAQQKSLKDADRKVVEGLLEKAKRGLLKAKKDPDLAKEKREKIKEHIADLQYINHFPGELYIPLFNLPEEDLDLKEKLIAKRNKIRDQVNQDLANLAQANDGEEPAASPEEEEADELVEKKTTNQSKEERDPFFMYSDEEDDQSLTEAKPLTEEDLRQKRRKFGESYFSGRNRGGGRGGRGRGRGRFDRYKHGQENRSGWRGGRGGGRGRSRGQAHD
ncbi:hypothetical protein BSKO_00316 [Bryopsis sp. KO-2023]|nr:hypothetical protein BSKO_00316 [Bryopsis sp. KO-2023]